MPLPFVVFATTMNGFWRLRAVTTSKIAAESWPSISTVSQPNAANFSAQRIERRMGLRRAAEALKIVVVDERDDVGEPERGRHQHGLPGRSFLHLAVAQHRVDDAIGLSTALGERHADDHRQAVAKRAGRSLDSRIAVIGMTAEAAVRLAVTIEIFARENAHRPRGSRIESCSRGPSTSGRCRARCRPDCAASGRDRWRRRSRCRRRRSRCAAPGPAGRCPGSGADKCGNVRAPRDVEDIASGHLVHRPAFHFDRQLQKNIARTLAAAAQPVYGLTR